MRYSSLSREEIISVIEGKGLAGRIPMIYHFWSAPERFGEHEAYARKLMEKYPCDVQTLGINIPEVFSNAEGTNYSWTKKTQPVSDTPQGIDSVMAIEDWDELDDVLANFPDPYDERLIPQEIPAPDGRYRLATWWYCLFERMWSLRGMENALMDFMLYPDEVHRLFDVLTDFYCKMLERCKNELHADGVFVSDDLGSQTGPMFSPATFDEFFAPCYKRIFDKAHELGMHFWLHTCGNIEPFIPKFIELGLDVLHPIQKYTMDEVEIAKQYGDRICIWAGFDVQRIIPYGTPEDVRKEIRFMVDAYARPDGRFMLTNGNSLTEDCPIGSFEALLDESAVYGTQKVQELKAKR